VLHHSGAGDLAVLGHVPHQDHRRLLFLGQAHHLAGGGAHLGHRAGGGLQLVAPQGLDGVDDHEVELIGLQTFHHLAQARLGGEAHGGVGEAHALGPGAHLLHRLFAGDIGDGGAAQGRLGHHL